MRSARSPALVAVVALVLAACSSGGAASPSAAASCDAVRPRRPRTIGEPRRHRPRRRSSSRSSGPRPSRALSTRPKTAYEAANPGTTLTISTDSSSALETQIEQGAPADVFLSADTTNPQKLVDKGLTDRSRRRPSPATS